MTNRSKIQHAQTLMFAEEIIDLKRLTGRLDTKNALSDAVEAFLELRPVKDNGTWKVPLFPGMNVKQVNSRKASPAPLK